MEYSIYVKLYYSILAEISSDANTNIFYFEIPIKDKNSVKIELVSTENTITSTQKVNISEELWKFLQTKETDIIPSLREEVTKIRSDGSSAIKKLLSLIKYNFARFELDERLVSSKKSEWSTNNADWQLLPKIIVVAVDGHFSYSLNSENAKTIQEYIYSGFEPFLALRYIHKAKNDILPRDKWIDATIAAELAVKEFMIRLKPDIETLLLTMPSPPLDKLYGSVLESFGFSKSPKLKEIREGIKIRNDLVHKPKVQPIKMGDAHKYVQDINIAIFHLMTLLYPNDSFIKSFYESLDLKSSRK